MENIIINSRERNYIQGLYHGQPYKVSLTDKKDILGMLSDREAVEVLEKLYLQEKHNPMLLVRPGSIVRISIEEGHMLFEYDLVIQNIEEEYVDDNGNYGCTAFGIGIREEDEELANEYTHMVDSTNLVSIIKLTEEKYCPTCNNELFKAINKDKNDEYVCAVCNKNFR